MTTYKRLNQQEMIQAINDRVKIVSPKHNLSITWDEKDQRHYIVGSGIVVIFDDVKDGSGSSIMVIRKMEMAILDKTLDIFLCSLFPDEWYIETEADE